MSSKLSYRLANESPPGYGVLVDGVEIGSVSLRERRGGEPAVWHWGVDTMLAAKWWHGTAW